MVVLLILWPVVFCPSPLLLHPPPLLADLDDVANESWLGTGGAKSFSSAQNSSTFSRLVAERFIGRRSPTARSILAA
jgi:hypothetical protein